VLPFANISGNPKDESPINWLRMSSPMAALWGSRNIQVWLAHGFTLVRDAGENDLLYGQLALRDAVKLMDTPFIEIHISNVHKREPFRHHSYFSDIAEGVIVGLGVMGYELAALYALDYLAKPK